MVKKNRHYKRPSKSTKKPNGAGVDDETIRESPNITPTRRIDKIDGPKKKRPLIVVEMDGSEEGLTPRDKILCGKVVDFKGYKIVELIAQGGFSDVYKAIEKIEVTNKFRITRSVAIKVLRKENEHDKEIVKNFCFGILVMSLFHKCPHIQKNYRCNTRKTLLEENNPLGNYFVVTDFIDGITLSKYIEKNKARVNDPSYLDYALG